MYLKENDDMTVIQKMLCEGNIELEEKLCNSRVTKFMKICGDIDSRRSMLTWLNVQYNQHV